MSTARLSRRGRGVYLRAPGARALGWRDLRMAERGKGGGSPRSQAGTYVVRAFDLDFAPVRSEGAGDHSQGARLLVRVLLAPLDLRPTLSRAGHFHHVAPLHVLFHGTVSNLIVAELARHQPVPTAGLVLFEVLPLDRGGAALHVARALLEPAVSVEVCLPVRQAPRPRAPVGAADGCRRRRGGRACAALGTLGTRARAGLGRSAARRCISGCGAVWCDFQLRASRAGVWSCWPRGTVLVASKVGAEQQPTPPPHDQLARGLAAAACTFALAPSSPPPLSWCTHRTLSFSMNLAPRARWVGRTRFGRCASQGLVCVWQAVRGAWCMGPAGQDLCRTMLRAKTRWGGTMAAAGGDTFGPSLRGAAMPPRPSAGWVYVPFGQPLVRQGLHGQLLPVDGARLAALADPFSDAWWCGASPPHTQWSRGSISDAGTRCQPR